MRRRGAALQLGMAMTASILLHLSLLVVLQPTVSPQQGRATNVVTGDGNIGAFRQWTVFGTGRDGYYVHMFRWEAQNNFSYLAAQENTAQFVTWMFEHGQSVADVSPVARSNDADYVTFKDGRHDRRCVGFRRLGKFQRGGYDSVTGGILCAPPGKTMTDKDIALFIDNVRLQDPAS
jgi:hypothetical protein